MASYRAFISSSRRSSVRAYANNHYYNVGATFFSETDGADQNNRVTQAEALAGGGSILSLDPCYNAKGGVFNLTNAELISAKVGAPQWQVTFVEKEEDLTLPCLEGAHTWDFNDARYFTGTIEKHKVRDMLYMGAKDVKLTVDAGVINYTAATVTKKNVPLDGYVAFKVNQPGSVYINADDPEQLANHLVIAVGPVDGSSATVKGGAVANTHNTTNQKILISDITEESLVYVYASGPIGLKALAWALDVRQVNTALGTPAPAVEPGKIDQGQAQEAVVTWAPIDNAGSYSVVFCGKTYKVEDGRVVFNADSDAIITKGIISLLIGLYSGRTPQEILSSDFSVVEKIGLRENLSPTRANGLVSMIAKIKEVATINC